MVWLVGKIKDMILTRKARKRTEERLELPVSFLGDLRVVLLLMVPKTRRFEFMQLDFDSNKAVVGDVLSRVPHSVMVGAVLCQQQSYEGICDRTGQELCSSTRLADACCGSTNILIAIPSVVDLRECARLANTVIQEL